jgi:hypothetical protein
VKTPEDWEFSDYAMWIKREPSTIESQNSITMDRETFWHMQRVRFFRDELGLPHPDEYEQWVRDFNLQKKEEKEFQKYILC